MKFLECNYFKDAESLNENGKRVFDVITYQSMSYFTKKHEIRVNVGLGDLELPPLPTSKRMRVKSCVRRMCVSNGGEDGAKGPARLDKDSVEASSQDKNAAPSEAVAATFVDADAIFRCYGLVDKFERVKLACSLKKCPMIFWKGVQPHDISRSQM